jgi:hypothetical protein
VWIVRVKRGQYYMGAFFHDLGLNVIANTPAAYSNALLGCGPSKKKRPEGFRR